MDANGHFNKDYPEAWRFVCDLISRITFLESKVKHLENQTSALETILADYSGNIQTIEYMKQYLKDIGSI